jgi:hypothetical protein
MEVGEVGPSSFVENIHATNAENFLVRGLSLESILREFNIEHVDLLKIDCKYYEFYLTENLSKNVDRIKIKFSKFGDIDFNNLLKLLMNTGFEYVTYQHEPSHHVPSFIKSCIYGVKKGIL